MQQIESMSTAASAVSHESRVPGSNLFLLFGCGIWLAWSAIRPHAYLTWTLEVLPGVLAMVAVLATCNRFRFYESRIHLDRVALWDSVYRRALYLC